MGHDALHRGVGLRVNAGHVQGVITATDTQKTRALLESFGAQPSDFQQLLSVRKSTVRFPPAHHGFGRGGGQTRDTRQKGNASGVEIYPHSIHAIFHHGF